jgi:hypothetical protein
MNPSSLTQDLLFFSLLMSVLFGLGIVRFFYKEQMYARITVYSIVYFISMYCFYQILIRFTSVAAMLPPMDEVVILNLFILFLSFALMASHSILPRLTDVSSQILIQLIAMFLFPALYFFTHFGVFHRISLMDQGNFSFLFLATGCLVWFFEVFMKSAPTSDSSLTPSSFDANFLFLLGMPFALTVAVGSLPDVEIIPLLTKYFYSFCFVFTGMITVRRQVDFPRGFLMLGFFSSASFVSISIQESPLVLFPLCFALGMFLTLGYDFFEKRKWTASSILIVLSQAIVSGIAIFSVLLIVPDSKWPHSPWVVLGVQALYALTVFLLSALFASSVYFLSKRSET